MAEAATSDIARSAKRSVSAKRSASAKHSAAGRPSGTPENLGFDFFVQQLLVDARAVGVKLTIYRSKSKMGSDWGGSLLKTIELLRAHLPDKFVPKANLGKVLDRIARSHAILLAKMDHPRNSVSG